MTVNIFSTIAVYITAPTLWVVFLVVLAIFMTLAGILFYHWNRFGFRITRIALAEIVFILGSLILLAGMVGSIGLY